jgi:hypothetical protein
VAAVTASVSERRLPGRRASQSLAERSYRTKLLRRHVRNVLGTILHLLYPGAPLAKLPQAEELHVALEERRLHAIFHRKTRDLLNGGYIACIICLGLVFLEEFPQNLYPPRDLGQDFPLPPLYLRYS